MKLAITGATGYIGQRLLRSALRGGHEVVALSRRAPHQHGVAWHPYDLADVGPLDLPRGLDVVFHLAARTHGEFVAEYTELFAAERLLDATQRTGATIVFVSSQAARPNAPTAYGRVKWQIEAKVTAAGGRIVRPGQVYGGPEAGLFGELCALVRRAPVIPEFLPAPRVQPIHVDDLVTVLLSCLSVPAPVTLCVAEPTPIAFTTFLRAVARGRSTRQPLAVPVPSVLVRAATTILPARLRVRFGLDRLASLFSLPPMASAGDLRRLKIRLRPLADGMPRHCGERRELIREGRALLEYVLRKAPACSIVRRYVSAIETLRNGHAMQLPMITLRFPSTLAMLDGATCMAPVFSRELTWRFDATLALAEATPEGADRFLGLAGQRRRTTALFCIARAATMEILRRLLRMTWWPLLRGLGRNWSSP